VPHVSGVVPQVPGLVPRGQYFMAMLEQRAPRAGGLGDRDPDRRREHEAIIEGFQLEAGLPTGSSVASMRGQHSDIPPFPFRTATRPSSRRFAGIEAQPGPSGGRCS
jgi:hypothetical protein